MHVFDAATGWVFRMTFAPAVHMSPRVLRLVRLRQALYASLGSWLAACVAEVAAGTQLVPGALLVLSLIIPGVWALFPLLWVSSKELWGKNSLVSVLLPITFLPCVAPFMGGWVALQLRQEERKLTG